MQVDGLEEQQGHQGDRLDPGEPPGRAPAGLHLVPGVGQGARLHAGPPAALVWAWWRLCLSSHQVKLNPAHRLVSTRPMAWLRLRLRLTWRWPASWAMKLSWPRVKAMPRATTMVHQLLARRTPTVPRTTRATDVAAILTE